MEIIELPIEFEYNGQVNKLYPSLIITDDGFLVLVDTGYPDFMPLIEKEILKNGFKMENLNKIIITHYDDDHIGSLFDFKEKYPWIRIIASVKESKFISGEMKSERMIQAEEMLEKMPNEEIEFGKWFVQQLKNLKHIPVNDTVNDGDLIFDNQCQVMATPGHTSGHISLYFPSLRAVITGDAAVNENQQMKVANPHFCLDLEAAEKSLVKLMELKADTYYCYHGGKTIF